MAVQLPANAGHAARARSTLAGAETKHVIERRGGFALTPELVESARAHIRDQAVSGQRVGARRMRVDPRQLAILTDYVSWLEAQLEAEEEAHNRTHVQLGELELGRQREVAALDLARQDELGPLLLRLSQARGLLLRRPRWRLWGWRRWWQAVTDWIDPERTAPAQTAAGPPAPPPDSEPSQEVGGG